MNRRKQYLHDAACFYSALVATETCCTKTPVQDKFEAWREAEKAARAADPQSFPALHDYAIKLADEVVFVQSKTPRDLLFKMASYTNYFEHAPCDGPLGNVIYDEARLWLGIEK